MSGTKNSVSSYVKNLTNDKKKALSFKHPSKNVSVTTRGISNTPNTEKAELSKYIWKINDANISPVIEWRIVTKALSKIQLYFCKLCLSEKFY